jgi:hypothetical protein
MSKAAEHLDAQIRCLLDLRISRIESTEIGFWAFVGNWGPLDFRFQISSAFDYAEGSPATQTLDEIVFEDRSEADTPVPNFIDGFISPPVGELLYNWLNVVRCGELKHGSHLTA